MYLSVFWHVYVNMYFDNNDMKVKSETAMFSGSFIRATDLMIEATSANNYFFDSSGDHFLIKRIHDKYKSERIEHRN